MLNDTIAAIATPPGTGGIAIIKISGPDALGAAEILFKPANPQRSLPELPSQSMLYGHVYDPGQGDLIDEVLITVLKGPHSFTGEDVVEINCHGGPQVSRTILDLLLERGLRLAEPGEFTRRAFMNGRIDLTQAEATIDLIQARTRRAARLGGRMLKGGLGNKIQSLLRIIDESRMRIEAAIEFGEETDMDVAPQDIQDMLGQKVLPVINQLIVAHQHGEWLRNGLRIVLVGKPNVGKSSLMNRLLQKERVIVTPIAGTTRDTIEEGFEIEGVPILLTDTAGLRRHPDPIERVGQEKAWQAIEQADLLLFMIDGSQSVDDYDRELADKVEGRPHLVVRNKVDIVADPARRASFAAPPLDGYLDISALRGDGLETLKTKIMDHFGEDLAIGNDTWLPSRRQKDLLMKVQSLLSDSLATSPTIDALAMDLKDCEHYFNQIIGIDVEPDVLETIFKRFCIGK